MAARGRSRGRSAPAAAAGAPAPAPVGAAPRGRGRSRGVYQVADLVLSIITVYNPCTPRRDAQPRKNKDVAKNASY